MTYPSSTIRSSKPTLRNEPTTSSLDGDLVFSSGNSEGDLPNVNGNSEPNAGVGIGFGLLVVTPLVILVVGIIYEIKRRKRRRKRKKAILPLQNTPIPKDVAMTHTRQNAASVQGRQIIRSAPITRVADKTTKAEICEISAKGTDAMKETKEATAAVATFQKIRSLQIRRSVPTMSTTSASDAKETQKATSRVGISESLKKFKDTSAVQRMRGVTGDAKETRKDVSCDGISKSLKREISTKDTSAPIMSRTSASGANEPQKAASRVGISESLKKELSTNDTSAVQEMKRVTGDGDTFQQSSAPTTSTESAGAVENKKAATDSGVVSSLKREIVAKETRKKEATTVVTATFSAEMSVSSSISTQSSGSIQSMTSFAIKSTKNLGAKKTKESIADVTTHEDHATRQITKNVHQSTQEETVRVETSESGESRPTSEISAKDANVEKVTREEYTLSTITPDEVCVQSSSSTQSSESIQSMTRFAIKSTKRVIETNAKKEADDEGVSTSTDDTKVVTAINSSRIVKKDDAATFFEMLSNLQHFFDCNVDISAGNSPRTPS